MAYDYGDRQPRVDFLLEALRDHPQDGPIHVDHTGRSRTRGEMAQEIEAGTEFGRGVVAVAGLVFQALGSGKPPPGV